MSASESKSIFIKHLNSFRVCVTYLIINYLMRVKEKKFYVKFCCYYRESTHTIIYGLFLLLYFFSHIKYSFMLGMKEKVHMI